MTELLPCPFCGGEAERFECEETDNRGGDVIGCKHCQASTRVFFGRKEGLLEAWNTRAAEGGSRMTEKWKPIETAPITGEWLLLYEVKKRSGSVFIGRVVDGEWHTWPGTEPGWPTHWMPLPHPPQVQE